MRPKFSETFHLSYLFSCRKTDVCSIFDRICPESFSTTKLSLETSLFRPISLMYNITEESEF